MGGAAFGTSAEEDGFELLQFAPSPLFLITSKNLSALKTEELKID